MAATFLGVPLDALLVRDTVWTERRASMGLLQAKIRECLERKGYSVDAAAAAGIADAVVDVVVADVTDVAGADAAADSVAVAGADAAAADPDGVASDWARTNHPDGTAYWARRDAAYTAARMQFDTSDTRLWERHLAAARSSRESLTGRY